MSLPLPEDLLTGASHPAERLRDQIDRVARTPLTTVLVTAERGLRPELVARAIHERSPTVATGPFHAVSCATLLAWPGGAPTFDEHCPLLAAARGGTLFLEEVSGLDTSTQGRLHDFLERCAAGADPPELRVVASSTGDLAERADEGRFREDLLYRLNVLSIRIPPLRERRGDVAALAGRLLQRMAASNGAAPAALAPSAVEALEDHGWPGNLDELEAVLLLALLRSGSGPIEADQLALGDVMAGSSREELIPLPPGSRSLRAVEEAVIRRVLQEEGGNRSRTARVLGINRTTLYNKLRLYGIHK